MFMFKLHDNKFIFSGFWLCVFGCYLFKNLYLFVYLFTLIEGVSFWVFYHCVSIVISFDFISLVTDIFHCRIDV